MILWQNLFGLLGAAIMGANATYETRCYRDDCDRVRCNNFGYDCSRVDHLGTVGYMKYRDREVCDEDGDNCHWVPTRTYYGDGDFDDFSD